MHWWQALILGLVEGITEYLPVSSTGHLILATELMRFDAEARPHVDAFNIVVQGGAILAVLGLYFARVKDMVLGSLVAATTIALGKAKPDAGSPVPDAFLPRIAHQYQSNKGFRLALNIFIAFLPAVVFGLLFDDLIESHLFSTWPVLIALAVGGVWMILLDRWRKRRLAEEAELSVGEHESRFNREIDDLTPLRALLIGIFQVVAMWPGTSRSMMTIAGGTLLGLKPRAAAEFSFLLGLPTLGGACVYKLAKNLYESHQAGTANMFDVLGLFPITIGLVVATVSAVLAVKWLVAFLTKHGLAAFGYYRLILTVVLGTLVLTGTVAITSSEQAPQDHPPAEEHE